MSATGFSSGDEEEDEFRPLKICMLGPSKTGKQGHTHSIHCTIHSLTVFYLINIYHGAQGKHLFVIVWKACPFQRNTLQQWTPIP